MDPQIAFFGACLLFSGNKLNCNSLDKRIAILFAVVEVSKINMQDILFLRVLENVKQSGIYNVSKSKYK